MLLAEVAVGSSVKALCEKGDALLLEETGKVSLIKKKPVIYIKKSDTIRIIDI